MPSKKNGQHILVTGGTGFIGSNLVRYLLKTGNDVAVYHRKESSLQNLADLSFESAIGDLADEKGRIATLSKAMEGREIVFNLAVCGDSLRKHQRLREVVNVEAVRDIAKVARKLNVNRLIHISSSTAVGFPLNNEIADETFDFNGHHDHYAVTKRQGEMEILKEVEKGLDAVIAIPCSTVGAKGMKANQYNAFFNIARGKTFVYPPGGLCLTNIEDLIKGLVLCWKNGHTGHKYIFGGHNIAYKQYFDQIALFSGGKRPLIRLPKTLLPWLGLGVEVMCNFLGKENTIDKHVGKMISSNLFYSSDRAAKELGYTITDWHETIKVTIHELQKKECFDV